jgi:hypothetical protein
MRLNLRKPVPASKVLLAHGGWILTISDDTLITQV